MVGCASSNTQRGFCPHPFLMALYRRLRLALRSAPAVRAQPLFLPCCSASSLTEHCKGQQAAALLPRGSLQEGSTLNLCLFLPAACRRARGQSCPRAPSPAPGAAVAVGTGRELSPFSVTCRACLEPAAASPAARQHIYFWLQLVVCCSL